MDNIKNIAEQNSHIPTSEIEQDIRDTEREIIQSEEEAQHLEQTPLSLASARLDHMRASTRRSANKERQEFIEKLKAILKYRKENKQ